MNRRGFLGAALSPLLVPLLPPEQLRTFTPLRFLTDVRPAATRQGQTVEDISICFPGRPCDRMHRVSFYRESQPSVIVNQFTLNQRASWRWCAMPDHEILVPPGDRLLWRVESWPSSDEPVAVDVWMQGRDRATGQVVVNQGIVVP